MSGILASIRNAFLNVGVLLWDTLLTLVNLVTPNIRPGHVVPKGHPGEAGKWPEYVPPGAGDSRSACPMLNAMANHGILPHDGRNIPFTELTRTIRATCNFAPTFCFFVPNFAANMLHKNYKTDTLDLADLNLHNGIEHDASLTREDVFHQADQGVPHVPFIRELLASASGKAADGSPQLTIADLARYSAKRRTDARRTNPGFTLSLFHKMFGSSNSSTLLTIFGGRVHDLEPLLIEERIPDGWEPRVRSKTGLTMSVFNVTALRVELGSNGKPLASQRN